MTPVDEQVEAEKLRQVRAMIEDILREYDVLAHVVLAGRGRIENFMQMRASWSNLYVIDLPGGEAALRLRSKLADYNGDVAAQQRDQQWSVGAVSAFGIALGQDAMAMLEVSKQLDAATGAEHAPLKNDDPRNEP
jgi:hypothetical protein